MKMETRLETKFKGYIQSMLDKDSLDLVISLETYIKMEKQLVENKFISSCELKEYEEYYKRNN